MDGPYRNSRENHDGARRWWGFGAWRGSYLAHRRGPRSVDKAARLGISLDDSVVASDAFFPFSDAVELAATAGATAIVQPGGSNRDAEVTAAADRLGLSMVHTAVRHFRH